MKRMKLSVLSSESISFSAQFCICATTDDCGKFELILIKFKKCIASLRLPSFRQVAVTRVWRKEMEKLLFKNHIRAKNYLEKSARLCVCIIKNCRGNVRSMNFIVHEVKATVFQFNLIITKLQQTHFIRIFDFRIYFERLKLHIDLEICWAFLMSL